MTGLCNIKLGSFKRSHYLRKVIMAVTIMAVIMAVIMTFNQEE